MYSPNQNTDTRGRGRGRGRGTGSVRVKRGNPANRVSVQGRHSSYTPSQTRPQPRNPYGDKSQAGEIITGAPRGNPLNTRRGTMTIPSRSRGGVTTPGRPLPKFSEVAIDDEPTPPPRSPHVSPRISNLPKLPPRPGTSETNHYHSSPKPVRPAPKLHTSTPETVNGEEPKVLSEEKEQKRRDMRHKCLEEIYQTEKDYIDDVETLINVFIFPLRAMQILDEHNLKNIFSNVEVLINCNKEMLDQLEKAIQSNQGDDTKIGHVFTQLADYFKMYKGFCANQQTSLATVELLTKKNSQFKKKLDVCHTDARCKGLFLQSFLIKPIQRVCKYPLLLRELIKFTPESHPDWDPLQSAFSKINGVVADINEAQRQAEGLQRISEVTKMIDGVDTLVAPGRYYVKEGELTFYKSAKSRNGEKRHVFFFTDLIILTNRKGEKKFDHKLSIDLDSCKLIVIADSNYIKNAFELNTGNKHKKCILSGESAAESNLWIKEIRGLIKSYQKRKLLEMEEQKKKKKNHKKTIF